MFRGTCLKKQIRTKRTSRVGFMLRLLGLFLLCGREARAELTTRYNQVLPGGGIAIAGNTVGLRCDAFKDKVPNTDMGVDRPDCILADKATCEMMAPGTGDNFIQRVCDGNAGVQGQQSNFVGGSTATLVLPPNATVTYARLYWAARADSSPSTEVTLSANGQGIKNYKPDESLLKNAKGNNYYQLTKDVTPDIIKNKSSSYDIKGINVKLGNDTVSLAGWSIIATYSVTDGPSRQVVVSDGLEVASAMPDSPTTLMKFMITSDFDISKENSGYFAFISYGGTPTIDQQTEGILINKKIIFNNDNPMGQIFNGTRTGVSGPFSSDAPRLSGAPGSMHGLDMDLFELKTDFLAKSMEISAYRQNKGILIGAVALAVPVMKMPESVDMRQSCTGKCRESQVFGGGGLGCCATGPASRSPAALFLGIAAVLLVLTLRGRRQHPRGTACARSL